MIDKRMPPENIPTPSSAEKIVVITGDSVFGERLTKALSEAGYQTILVTDGSVGIKAITDNMPHLVLLDVILPGVSGYEILEKKAAESLLAKIPVYLMSTQGTPVNMRLVPQNSVAKFVLALHSDTREILEMVNAQFGKKIAPTATAVANPDQKTILWVEDDKLIGNILGKKLQSSGFNLIHATNGEEALQQLQSVTPQGIVVDLLLPGMNGFDILERIRKDARFAKTPVMVLSNLSKPSDIEKAKNLGAQKFMVKAIASLDQIVAEIRSLIK